MTSTSFADAARMTTGRYEHVVEIAAARALGQDRADVFVLPDGLVVALADGAGGIGSGEVAAQALVDAAGASSTETSDWTTVIESVDRDLGRLGHGETTAVVLSMNAHGISGASVGDSGAWLVGNEVIDLTERQVRKPLVGGGCDPVAFHCGPLGIATLLVASDGLLRYAKQQDIVRVARQGDLAVAARALIDLVRLRSGALQDDVSVVLCRSLG